MNGPSYDFDQQLQTTVEAHDERQDLIAACMKRAGFDYKPVPYSGPREQQPHPGYARAGYLMVPPLDPDRVNVAKWGYGLDPEDWEDTLVPPGADPEAAKTASDNDAYRASLSAAEQAAYDTTLSGSVDAEGRPLAPDGGGCMAESYAQVPEVAVSPSANQAFLADHEDLIFAMVELARWDVGMDPRALALDKEWAKCAASEGLDLSGRAYSVSGHPASDASMANRPSPINAIDHARSLGEDGRPVDQATPGYLRAYPAQVEVALIDFDCRQEVDYMKRVIAIQTDLEQQFLDANQDRLEAMKTAATREG
jgi:hypothetical protein